MLIITGTRPEIIKMAPVYHALKLSSLDVRWCHTGQHDSLATQTFSVFEIKPDVFLTRPAGSTLTQLVAGLMCQLESVLEDIQYSGVLVHGDTSSTFASALMAFYKKTPIIAHIEAGLRSGNMHHPFPEESNRTLVASLATRHYAPTVRAAEALKAEGVGEHQILVTGNTAIDAQHYLLKRNLIDITEEFHVLVTAHRRENWPYIGVICDAVKTLAAQHPSLRFTFAVHPNPSVKRAVMTALADHPHIRVVPPLDYFALQQCMAKSCLILTDSGGIQEEAPTFGIRTVVLRETTERPEALNNGLSCLVGSSDISRIVAGANDMLSKGREPYPWNPFGKGEAALMITSDLEVIFGTASNEESINKDQYFKKNNNFSTASNY